MCVDKKASYDVKVSGVDISPYPIARGKDATFSIAATTGKDPFSSSVNRWIRYYLSVVVVVGVASESIDFLVSGRMCAGKEISGGKLVIDVSYFGWHIHSETHDLCSETSCPVSIGDFVVAHSQVLPGFTPPVSRFFLLVTLGGQGSRIPTGFIMVSCLRVTLSYEAEIYNCHLLSPFVQGSYSLQMRMYDGSNKQLTCIAFGFDIGFIADVADI